MALDSKRMAGIRIYSILKKYSDENHVLTQKQIANYLEKDYGIVLERKAISSHLYDLELGGFKVEITPKGAYLYERDFDDLEIRMLVDAVLGSKYISKKHSKDIIDKLCNLSNKYFKSSVKNIYTLDTWEKSENQELFLNIEVINEAINKGKQIQFIYNRYEIDKKLHSVTEEPYIVSPYQLVFTNGNYYLIGNIEDQDAVFNFKLDRITKIDILKDKRRNKTSKKMDLQISEYVRTHPYICIVEHHKI